MVELKFVQLPTLVLTHLGSRSTGNLGHPAGEGSFVFVRELGIHAFAFGVGDLFDVFLGAGNDEKRASIDGSSADESGVAEAEDEGIGVVVARHIGGAFAESRGGVGGESDHAKGDTSAGVVVGAEVVDSAGADEGVDVFTERPGGDFGYRGCGGGWGGEEEDQEDGEEWFHGVGVC